MRAKRLVVGSSLLFAVVACSSATPGTTSDVVLPPSGAAAPVAPSTPGATNANALVYFDGAVDTVRGVMNLVVRDAAGTIKSESTLPYGDNPGQVYMHTCASAYNSGTHQLTGNVQAVNLMSGTVTGMNAVVDSVSVTGVTLASGSGAGGSSGIIASYGSVAVNTPNCASTQPWAFQNLSGDPSFTFKGHADGTAPVGPCTHGSTTVNPSGAITTFTVPAGCTVVHVVASGAQGGSGTTAGGLGATMSGDFSLASAQVLKVLVGQQPATGNGGGGGTFVVDQTSNTPLIVAGGGGGGAGECCGGQVAGLPGLTTANGTAGTSPGCTGGAGGTGGGSDNGKAGGSYGSGGGGGFTINGADGTGGSPSGLGGASFTNGGAGGTGAGTGGFGGGGGGGKLSGYTNGAGGGGGGYAGGGGSCGQSQWGSGGGGGSFNNGANQSNTSGAQSGSGVVVFTY